MRNPDRISTTGKMCDARFRQSPNPVTGVMHLSRKESIIDLVVSIMDMPGRNGLSKRAAPGMNHGNFRPSVPAEACKGLGLKFNPLAFLKKVKIVR